jgi:hypothetical protein
LIAENIHGQLKSGFISQDMSINDCEAILQFSRAIASLKIFNLKNFFSHGIIDDNISKNDSKNFSTHFYIEISSNFVYL